MIRVTGQKLAYSLKAFSIFAWFPQTRYYRNGCCLVASLSLIWKAHLRCRRTSRHPLAAVKDLWSAQTNLKALPEVAGRNIYFAELADSCRHLRQRQHTQLLHL